MGAAVVISVITVRSSSFLEEFSSLYPLFANFRFNVTRFRQRNEIEGYTVSVKMILNLDAVSVVDRDPVSGFAER